MLKLQRCNGLCEKGPLVKILPRYYILPVEAGCTEIVEKTLQQGELVQRLLYRDPATKKYYKSHHETNFYKKQHKVALRNIGEIDPTVVQDYLDRGGYQSLEKAVKTMSPSEVIEEVLKSGLRGRGGGGFPTGLKWKACAAVDNPPKYVICNGDEGDPGAFMDRSILEGDPHTVIEGMIICAYAIGAPRDMFMCG